MSEPNLPPTESLPPVAPQPFGPGPMEPRIGGCGKPVLIGCGVVFLLLGIAGIAVVLKAKDMLAWSLERAKPAVMANLGADVQPADRERFEPAFAAGLGEDSQRADRSSGVAAGAGATDEGGRAARSGDHPAFDVAGADRGLREARRHSVTAAA